MTSQGQGEPLLIDQADQGRSVCEHLSLQGVLAFDCEGVNLGPTGNLTLVQIATPAPETSVYIFDIYSCPELAEVIRGILESTSILKIVHDCRGERSNLWRQFGIQLRNVFDTQIAFHFLKPFKNDRISLTNLSKYYRVPPNLLKNEFDADFYVANPEFWARRPLSSKMISYAAADVINLHFFYEKMQNFENNMYFRRRCEEANLTEADLIGPNGGRNPNLRFFD